MEVDPARTHTFARASDFGRWLAVHHAQTPEVWVRIFKKGAGTPSITWSEAVIEALAWGWIDGIKKRGDDASWFQRVTPRRPKSLWSHINCAHAERLIADGRMQAPGLAAVLAAKTDGRWDAAYAGSAGMVLPDAVLSLIAADVTAKAVFDRLPRSAIFTFYQRLNCLKCEDSRWVLIETFVSSLRACGEDLFGG
jgi:uncharacterized protein YdeI (YjbR/CyaY-like superfamily)